jgi:hypothetical protein
MQIDNTTPSAFLGINILTCEQWDSADVNSEEAPVLQQSACPEIDSSGSSIHRSGGSASPHALLAVLLAQALEASS